jgi:hypothetical protein
MAYLIRQVSEETRLQEGRTIDTYLKEIQALEEELALHQRAWNGTIMVVNKVIEVITVLGKSLNALNVNLERAEAEWLAFWGIYKESSGSYPP